MKARISFISRLVFELDLELGETSSGSVITLTFLNFLVEMLRFIAGLSVSLGEWDKITSFIMSSTCRSMLEPLPSCPPFTKDCRNLLVLVWLVDLNIYGFSSPIYKAASRRLRSVVVLNL
jgi:hypothetical protein